MDNAAEIAFFDTEATKHGQTLTDMPAGNHSINIRCADEAGNSDNKTINASIFIDDSAPIITRVYGAENKIIIRTNENSVCRYSNDTLLECGFEFESANLSWMTSTNSLVHDAPWLRNQNYFIKCSDKYNNTNFGCGISLRAYENPAEAVSFEYYE